MYSIVIVDAFIPIPFLPPLRAHYSAPTSCKEQKVNGINQLEFARFPFGKGMKGIFKDLSSQDLWVMIQL